MAKEKKPKYYVVWKGRETGIYTSWDACKKQVDGFDGAQYKSFPTQQAANLAFQQNYFDFVAANKQANTLPITWDELPIQQQPVKDALAVDAACSGNPGKMEYRGVDVLSGAELFRQGPFDEGTNNVGEFLALVHGLALLKKMNSHMPVYTDSMNAIAWIKQKKCKTKLERTANNAVIFDLIARAEKWLMENSNYNTILKWETKLWGEIPADFGRK